MRAAATWCTRTWYWDGSTCGGHLLDATVRPCLEVRLTESPVPLRCCYDESAGLAMIDLRETSPIVVD